MLVLKTEIYKHQGKQPTALGRSNWRRKVTSVRFTYSNFGGKENCLSR